MSVPAPGAAVEVATWPPLSKVEIDGWQVGLSQGLTKRANSVLAWSAPADLPAAIAQVEAVYAEHGLPATFRVDRTSRPEALASALAARGYHAASVTDVWVRELSGLPLAPTGHGLRVAHEPDEEWIEAWTSGKGGAADAARRLLTGARAHYLSARVDGSTAGTLRVAYAQGWAALSCLAVRPQHRRAGLGRALTVAGLAHAVGAGAARAFLQVEVDNEAARALYGSLGFVHADRYEYAVRPVGGPPGA